jgi:hypothetical protein
MQKNILIMEDLQFIGYLMLYKLINVNVKL